MGNWHRGFDMGLGDWIWELGIMIRDLGLGSVIGHWGLGIGDWDWRLELGIGIRDWNWGLGIRIWIGDRDWD